MLPLSRRMKRVVAAVIVLLLSIDMLLYCSVIKISSPSGLAYAYDVAYDAKRYLPNWESLDTRPLPQWFDDAKFGIFIVWGVYSVPAYGNEWFWHNWKGGDPDVVKFMKENYPPGFTYGDFASNFGAELFNPDQWAEILKASGARYSNTTVQSTIVQMFILVFVSIWSLISRLLLIYYHVCVIILH